MIVLKPYPVQETVHRKTADGAYFWFGNEKTDESEAQVIVVGPLVASVHEYAAAAARKAGWTGFTLRSAEHMPACDAEHEMEVRKRGFFSIIMDNL